MMINIKLKVSNIYMSICFKKGGLSKAKRVGSGALIRKAGIALLVKVYYQEIKEFICEKIKDVIFE